MKTYKGDKFLSVSQRKVRVLFVYSDLFTFSRADLEILQKYFDVRSIEVTTFLVPCKGRNWLSYYTLFRGVLWADIVYLWWADLNACVTVLFSALLRKKSVVVVGGYEVAYVPEINYGTLLSPIGRLEVKFILAHASKILAVSKSSEKEILNFTKPKALKLVYNGVDTDRFKPLDDKENLVITVGGVSHGIINKKRLDTFVEASKYLTDIPFVIIGRILDDSIKQLRSKASRNVKFAGYVSDESLLRYYQKAKVYCQLSTQESFGVALAEAMSCGCVPVVTRKYSLPEIVGDTGFYVPYNDPEATAEAINKALISNKGLKARERITFLFSETRREKILLQEMVDVIRSR